MTKDIKALLAQRLAENNARHANANQSTYLEIGNELKRIAIDKIKPNPYQPRTVFEESEIASLAESIKEMGLLQPITVRATDNGNYELIAGERRLRAHQSLGKTHIEAIISQADDSELAILALAENASRQDLCDYEIGQALKNISTLFPNKSRLAESVGLDRKEMYRYLAYDDLPTDFLAKVSTNPKLLSRSAAYDIKQVLAQLKISAEKAEAVLSHVWELLELGKLEQGKIAQFITHSINTDALAKSMKVMPLDVKPILREGNQIGKFQHKGKKYVVEIKAKSLNEDQRSEIEKFITHLMTQTTAEQAGE